MIDWMHSNTAFISMLSSIATAFIWLLYLQIIVTSNSRQRRALVTINRGAGRNLDAHLVLCNLGYETVYVTDVIAELELDGETLAANITECDETTDTAPSNPLAGTLQGSLGNGDCRAIGTIRSILERIARQSGTETLDRAGRISVVVLFGRETSIGVRRRYRLIRSDGTIHLDADMMDTKRIPRGSARRYRESWGYDVPKGYVESAQAA
ncbi:hypothetical protein [Palleronia sp. LCG004]|uniref:hypothetical protein n=1 Tax=Palleronia sp. LCG004 TaxID=3079304 RepID=UPI0029431B3A|nr:hypothetical protein [Palleronia sp. LCG004]WOI57652.1 hypothetical protein RVY76_15495 [Palleronia sp. LCG004]